MRYQRKLLCMTNFSWLFLAFLFACLSGYCRAGEFEPGIDTNRHDLDHQKSEPGKQYHRVELSEYSLAVKRSEILNRLGDDLIDLDYEGVPLKVVISDLRHMTGLDIVPEWNDLRPIGIAPDDLVTIKLQRVTIGKALDRVLASVSASNQSDKAGLEVNEAGLIIIKRVGKSRGRPYQALYLADPLDINPESYGGRSSYGSRGSFGRRSGW